MGVLKMKRSLSLLKYLDLRFAKESFFSFLAQENGQEARFSNTRNGNVCCDRDKKEKKLSLVKRRPVKNSSAGLTLIEVLIALAIVAIAMTAVIKAVSQNIRGTGYLENKTIAMWISQEFLNEARVAVLTLPDAPDEWEQKIERLGQDWIVRGNQERTPNPRIKKIKISVFKNEKDETSLVALESYVYNEK